MFLHEISFEYMPSDVMVYAFQMFLDPSDLARLARVSKRMKFYVDNDLVWRGFLLQEEERFNSRNLRVEATSAALGFIDTETVLLVAKEGSAPLRKSTEDIRRQIQLNWDCPTEGMTWKQLFQLSTSNQPACKKADSRLEEWRFDPHSKLQFLELIDNNRSVIRQASKGINPLQLCSKPFTKYRNEVTFLIKDIGTWLRLGVVDRRIKLNNGDLIGDQEDCFNIGYCRSGCVSYHSDGSVILDTVEDIHTRLEAGNYVSIRWDSNRSCFSFAVNHCVKKIVRVSHKEHVEGHIYPCAQISWHSHVCIVENDPMELEGE